LTLGHSANARTSIVDELGYLPLELAAAHLFVHLVSRRYERASKLITSNHAISGRGAAFGDPVVASPGRDLRHADSVVDHVAGAHPSAPQASERSSTSVPMRRNSSAC
jgi:hypothetical protein